MKFLQTLEKRFGWLALPNITLYLMVAQILVYGLIAINYVEMGQLYLIPALVMQGEIWRVVTFIFMPPIVMHPIFMAFAWYIFYIMGTALEENWGTFRYNLFLWVGFLATIIGAFLVPGSVATNGFLLGSVFLAFAFLNPNFELMLFLILPVKIKWLALIMWGFYAITFLFGDWGSRMMVLATVTNFMLFFGRDIAHEVKARRRRMAFESQREQEANEPFHRCHKCGITDKSHPKMEFRYCSKCAGNHAYCEEHLQDHEHVKEDEE